MIKDVLVLDNSGQVLVNRAYDELLAVERDLVGSFLSALTHFGEETFSAQVQEIKFSKLRILISRNKWFCVAGIADLDDDITEINEILKGISEILLHLHEDNLSKNELPAQQTIRNIEQLIDYFVLPFRSFEEKIAEFWAEVMQPASQASPEEVLAALYEKQERIQEIRQSQTRTPISKKKSTKKVSASKKKPTKKVLASKKKSPSKITRRKKKKPTKKTPDLKKKSTSKTTRRKKKK